MPGDRKRVKIEAFNVIDPRAKQTHFTEGRTRLPTLTPQVGLDLAANAFPSSPVLQKYLGGQYQLSQINAQEAAWKKTDEARSKIKPIKDPDDVTASRKKAARRKQQRGGRYSTTTLSNPDQTLG